MPDAVKKDLQPPPTRAVDTTTVTMARAGRFARVAAARQRLLATWANGARRARSTQQIALQFKRWYVGEGRGRRTPFRFGDLGRDVAIVDRLFEANFELVDSPRYGAVDDLYAALGRALVELAVRGAVTQDKSGGWRITIDEVGTYVRDTYDFNEDQPLGSWDPGDLSRTAVLAPGVMVDAAEASAARRSNWALDPAGQAYWSVDNAGLRRFRARSGRGGDFLVFADIWRSRLARPVVVDVPA